MFFSILFSVFLQALTTADSVGPYYTPAFANLMMLVPSVVADLKNNTLTSTGCN